MPRDSITVTRHLDATEREARQRYLVVHPDHDEMLKPTTAGYANIQDWIDAGEPPAGKCPCAYCPPVAEDAPPVVASLRPHGAVPGE